MISYCSLHCKGVETGTRGQVEGFIWEVRPEDIGRGLGKEMGLEEVCSMHLGAVPLQGVLMYQLPLTTG